MASWTRTLRWNVCSLPKRKPAWAERSNLIILRFLLVIAPLQLVIIVRAAEVQPDIGDDRPDQELVGDGAVVRDGLAGGGR